MAEASGNTTEMDLLTQRVSHVQISSESNGQSAANRDVFSETLNVMTINMNGTISADERRRDVQEAITVSNQKDSPCQPDIIFAQEIGAPAGHKWLLDTKGYQYSQKDVTSKEAGIMWRKEKFEICPPHINNTFKEKHVGVFPPKDKERVKPPKEYKDIIPKRICAVVLKHRTINKNILAVSWHGPENDVKVNAKKYPNITHPTKVLKHQIFKLFQIYIETIYKKLLESIPVSFIVIGGDFNLDFEDSELQCEMDFSFEKYTMSLRRRDLEKGEKKGMIDNFLIYPSDKMEIEEIIPLDFREQVQSCNVSLQQENQKFITVSHGLRQIINPFQGWSTWFFVSELPKSAGILPIQLYNISLGKREVPPHTTDSSILSIELSPLESAEFFMLACVPPVPWKYNAVKENVFTLEKDAEMEWAKPKVNCYSGRRSWVLVQPQSDQWSWSLVNQPRLNNNRNQIDFSGYCERHKKQTNLQNSDESYIVISEESPDLLKYFMAYDTCDKIKSLPLTNLFSSTNRQTYSLDHDPVLARMTLEVERPLREDKACQTEELCVRPKTICEERGCETDEGVENNNLKYREHTCTGRAGHSLSS